MDTICALSTPYGRSALALIRISGPAALETIQAMVTEQIIPRAPMRAILRDSEKNLLDEAVVTFFKGPNSYTGEDLVEIGAHGNPIIVEKLIAEIVSRETIRKAEPGEFTSRAVANEKMTLDQVESLDWILNSNQIEGVRRGLQAKLSGLGTSSNEFSEKLTELLSDLQAQLDFSDHEVGQEDRRTMLAKTEALGNDLKAWARNFETHRYLLTKWMVALIGPPNSGKSSLFNKLIGENKAIVFDRPGTTRDYLEHLLTINGVEILLVDTAGIRPDPDEIEKIGIQKTLEVIRRADIVCWVDELGREIPEELAKLARGRKVSIHSKSDLGIRPQSSQAISVSIHGDGVRGLFEKLLPETSGDVSWTPLTSDRQKALVDAAAAYLQTAAAELASGQYLDMVTEQILMAARELGAIVEPPETAEVLKAIFSRFCIGK